MIEVEHVYKSFDAPVLRGVSLRARKGTLLGLVGPPAAGKSVLLRAIAGLLDIQAGSIRVGGKELVLASYAARSRVQQDLGMLFQNVALFDFMSVGDNIAFPLERAGVPAAEIKRRVHEELEYVGLAGFETRMPDGLSGGQKRRVGIARAAVGRPRFLLYDEPAAGLDPVTTSRIFALLRQQRERLGSTLIVVSSDIDRLLPVVDELAFMHVGRILRQGTTESLQSSKHPVIRQFLSGSIDGPL